MTAVLLLGAIQSALQRRHNEHDGVSNHQPHDCLLNRLFKAQMKENIKAFTWLGDDSIWNISINSFTRIAVK